MVQPPAHEPDFLFPLYMSALSTPTIRQMLELVLMVSIMLNGTIHVDVTITKSSLIQSFVLSVLLGHMTSVS